MKKLMFALFAIVLMTSCQKEVVEPEFYNISGVVYDTTGIPLSDVNICLEDTVNNVFINSLTDVNGAYSCKVVPGWSGKITPAKVGGFVFNPSQRIYVDVHQDYTDEDYNRLAPR